MFVVDTFPNENVSSISKTGFLRRAQKQNVSKEQHTDKKQPLLTFSFSFAASLATVGEQPESGELIMRFPAFGAEEEKTGREKV